MTNIVDRLRDIEMSHGQLVTPYMMMTASQAITEIERLRAALLAARPFVDDYHGQSADPVMAVIDAALGTTS